MLAPIGSFCRRLNASTPSAAWNSRRIAYQAAIRFVLTAIVVTVAFRAAAAAEAAQVNADAAGIRLFLEDAARAHPRLESARAEVDAVKARARAQGRPIYNPEIEGEFADSDDPDNDVKAVTLSKAFDITNKRASRAKVGRWEAEAAGLTFKAAKRSLYADLLSALAEFQTHKTILAVAQQRAAGAREFADIAKKRAEAGDLGRSELLTAQLTLSQALAEETTARGAFSLARQNLVALVGEVRPDWPTLPHPPITIPAIDPAHVRTLPEVRAARARSEALRAQIRVAQKERAPDPTIGASYGQEGSADFVGVRLSVPLPVFNSRKAEVEAARADRLSAELAIRDQIRAAEARLTESGGRYVVAARTWNDWRNTGVGALDEQRSVLQRLWRSGDINAVDYLVQLDQTYAAERAGIELFGAAWAAWADWLDASGTLFEWMETL